MCRRTVWMLLLGFATVGVDANCLAQSKQELALRISSFMTEREMHDTGISGLSPIQRAALDQWLSHYTAVILATRSGTESHEQSVGTYATGKGHWISEVSNNGAIVTLEDGSMWDVATIDQIDTALWLPITDITVIADPRPIGNYKYILVNTEDGEKASARYLGKH